MEELGQWSRGWISLEVLSNLVRWSSQIGWGDSSQVESCPEVWVTQQEDGRAEDHRKEEVIHEVWAQWWRRVIIYLVDSNMYIIWWVLIKLNMIVKQCLRRIYRNNVRKLNESLMFVFSMVNYARFRTPTVVLLRFSV